MIIIVMGPMGSGKGEQSRLLGQDLKIPQLSMGDLLRNLIASGTTLGKLSKEYVDKGLLVPDAIINFILQSRVQEEDCKNGYILDGCPRSLIQGVIFDNWLSTKNQKVDKVIFFDISEEETIQRVTSRAKKAIENGETPRNDDLNEMSIKNRMKEFFDQVLPLKMYYENMGVLQVVDARPSIEEIHAYIMKTLEY